MNRSAEKDYRVLVKVKNNHILSAIERKGYQNVAQFCEAHGLSQVEVGLFVNLKKSPLTKNGDWRESVQRIAAALDVCPSMLFDEAQYSPIEKNEATLELDASEVKMLMGNADDEMDPLQILLREEDGGFDGAVERALATLTPREAKVIRMRFGLDEPGCDAHTYAKIGEQFGITRERIRQIELKALRKLRHPTRSAPLRGFLTAERTVLASNRPSDTAGDSVGPSS